MMLPNDELDPSKKHQKKPYEEEAKSTEQNQKIDDKKNGSKKRVVFIDENQFSKSIFQEIESERICITDLCNSVSKKYPIYSLSFTDYFGNVIPSNDKRSIDQFKSLFPFHFRRDHLKSITFEINYDNQKVLFVVDDIKLHKMHYLSQFLEKKFNVSEESIEYVFENEKYEQKKISWSDNMSLYKFNEPNIPITIKEREKVTFTEGGIEKTRYIQPIINIKLMTGKNIVYPVRLDFTIQEIKEQLVLVLNVKYDEMRMIFDGKQIEDDQRLCDYHIKYESIIYLLPRLRGGGGTPFVDISNDSASRTIKFSQSAPKWRVITKNGLCLEGKCTNKNCEAYQNRVIISKGFGTYNIKYDEHENNCPLCQQYVKTTTCAFTNCLYSFSGIMVEKDGGQPQKKTPSLFCNVGNEYKLFDPEVAGEKSWISLVIQTKEATDNEYNIYCGVCKKYIVIGDHAMKAKDCKHFYHTECLQNMYEQEIQCPLCYNEFYE